MPTKKASRYLTTEQEPALGETDDEADPEDIAKMQARSLSPLVIQWLVTLMQDAEKPTDERFRAAQTILDVAGLLPPQDGY
jgi:hypothetical protein